MAGRIPPPIPTARGVRSAADPILSEEIDRFAQAQIPQLKLPHHAALSKPDQIIYESLLLREKESVQRFLRSLRKFGAVRVSHHGIPTEELRLALDNSDRIFTLDCCTSYGDHEQIDFRNSVDDLRIAEEASAAIGDRNYEIFRENVDNATIKLEAIARELANVIIQSGYNQSQEMIQFGESKLSIYRYHQSNVSYPNSSQVTNETSQHSGSYALDLHLFLESTELCLDSDLGPLSFETNLDDLVLTTGREVEGWSRGRIKSAQGKFMVKPFLLRTRRASISLQQKWRISKLKLNKTISVLDQILILFIIGLIYSFFSYVT